MRKLLNLSWPLVKDFMNVPIAILFVLFSSRCQTPQVHINKESQQSLTEQPPQTLIVGLDGISYFTFHRLWRQGRLPLFKEPAPMLSTFPSISDPNWSRLMNVPIPAGFNKSYFDPNSKDGSGLGKQQGSLLSHLHQVMDYEQLFDHIVPHNILGHATNLTWLNTSVRLWLSELPEKFLKTRGRKIYSAFSINTDLISHTEGEQAVEEFLVRFHQTLESLTQKRMNLFPDQKLEVVIVSDHGNEFTNIEMIPTEACLKNLGWSWKTTLRGPKEFAFTAPELITFGAFNTFKMSERSFAESLIRCKGVESVSYLDDSTPLSKIKLLMNGGQTVYEVLKDELTVKWLQGPDTLKLLEMPWLTHNTSKDLYFRKTIWDEFPYVFQRLREAFTENSQVRPGVLATSIKGYAFSNPTLEILTLLKGLRSMHGGLRQFESLGVVASTKSALEPIRSEDFRKLYSLDELHENMKTK